MVHSRLFGTKPPLLVQRCNGTTVGLGYLEVSMDCPCKIPFWTLVSVPRGRMAQFLPLPRPNLNDKHINAKPAQGSFQPTGDHKPTCDTPRKIMYEYAQWPCFLKYKNPKE